MTHHTFITKYVITQWYCVSEIMLTFKEYTCTIDMWSIGYVLAGMLSGKPLFPSYDYHYQLSIILNILGTPSIEDLCYLVKQIESANPLTIDLMEKCLMFGLKHQIEVSKALRHPYLQAYTHKTSLLWNPSTHPSSTLTTACPCKKKSSKAHVLSILSMTPHLMPVKQY
ncbi:kinase-like protein [Armillaria gallica]|uniref:Kinase-like protein n=1 Tax=Armillaria gallica TaxID=47427 RepID=A0A2H3DM27_ARMGA|nr:kinase-like protein [Armillaria gallica]